MLKSYWVGWGGVGGGPCDFGVSPSPFELDFGTLHFGTSDSGLTKTPEYTICNGVQLWSFIQTCT